MSMRILYDIDQNMDILVQAPAEDIMEALRTMCDGVMNAPEFNHVSRRGAIDMIVDRFNQAWARRDAKTVLH